MSGDVETEECARRCEAALDRLLADVIEELLRERDAALAALQEKGAPP